MIILKYMFDWGVYDTCIWSVSQEATEKYGYGIQHETLGISKELDATLKSMCAEFQTGLNWDYPPDPSPWTTTQREDFIVRMQEAYQALQKDIKIDCVLEDWTQGWFPYPDRD